MKNILFCLAALVASCFAQDIGSVENLIVSDIGSDSITISWNYVAGTFELHKYSLSIDSDLTSEFKCTSPSCSKTIYDLEACVEHTFDLTPIFYDLTGADVFGDIASTSGYTEDAIPGSVSNIKLTDDTDAGTTIVWSPPTVNGKCVDYYQVCYRLNGQQEEVCQETNDTQVTVVGMTACATYHIMVTPVTPSNIQGTTLDITVETRPGIPGPPEEVTLGLITEDTIQLLWNNPSENLLCLDKFLITIGETHLVVLKNSVRSRAEGFDNEFTFNPLAACNDYTIDICSANEAEETSEKVVRYASTEETEPLAPPTVTVVPNGSDGILVTWGDNENDRCAGSFEVCWNDGVHPTEVCEIVVGGGDNSLIITDLLPCTNYDIIVTVISPNGTFTSNSTSNSTATEDIRPGPVTDLMFKSVTVNELTITYGPPITHAQCMKEVITRVIDNNQKLLAKGSPKKVFQETFSGLAACTDYTVEVQAVSPTGKVSPVESISNTTLGDSVSEPQEFAVSAVTSNSVSLQWYQPIDNPRCVTEFILTWKVATASTESDSISISASTFKVEHIVDGLDACVEYEFSLISMSLLGPSAATVTLTQSTAC